MSGPKPLRALLPLKRGRFTGGPLPSLEDLEVRFRKSLSTQHYRPTKATKSLKDVTNRAPKRRCPRPKAEAGVSSHFLDTLSNEQNLGRVMVEDILALDWEEDHKALLIIPCEWKNKSVRLSQAFTSEAHRHDCKCKVTRDGEDYLQIPVKTCQGTMETQNAAVGSFQVHFAFSTRYETITLEDLSTDRLRLCGYPGDVVKRKGFWDLLKAYSTGRHALPVIAQLLTEVESDEVQTHDLNACFCRLSRIIETQSNSALIAKLERENGELANDNKRKLDSIVSLTSENEEKTKSLEALDQKRLRLHAAYQDLQKREADARAAQECFYQEWQKTEAEKQNREALLLRQLTALRKELSDAKSRCRIEPEDQIKAKCQQINLVHKSKMKSAMIGWNVWGGQMINENDYQRDILQNFFDSLPNLVANLGRLRGCSPDINEWSREEKVDLMDSYFAHRRQNNSHEIVFWAVTNTMRQMAKGASRNSIKPMVECGMCVHFDVACNHLKVFSAEAQDEILRTLSDMPLRSGCFDNFQTRWDLLGRATSMMHGTLGYCVRPRLAPFKVWKTILENAVTDTQYRVVGIISSAVYERYVMIQERHEPRAAPFSLMCPDGLKWRVVTCDETRPESKVKITHFDQDIPHSLPNLHKLENAPARVFLGPDIQDLITCMPESRPGTPAPTAINQTAADPPNNEDDAPESQDGQAEDDDEEDTIDSGDDGTDPASSSESIDKSHDVRDYLSDIRKSWVLSKIFTKSEVSEGNFISQVFCQLKPTFEKAGCFQREMVKIFDPCYDHVDQHQFCEMSAFKETEHVDMAQCMLEKMFKTGVIKRMGLTVEHVHGVLQKYQEELVGGDNLTLLCLCDLVRLLMSSRCHTAHENLARLMQEHVMRNILIPGYFHIQLHMQAAMHSTCFGGFLQPLLFLCNWTKVTKDASKNYKMSSKFVSGVVLEVLFKLIVKEFHRYLWRMASPIALLEEDKCLEDDDCNSFPNTIHGWLSLQDETASNAKYRLFLDFKDKLLKESGALKDQCLTVILNFVDAALDHDVLHRAVRHGDYYCAEAMQNEWLGMWVGVGKHRHAEGECDRNDTACKRDDSKLLDIRNVLFVRHNSNKGRMALDEGSELHNLITKRSASCKDIDGCKVRSTQMPACNKAKNFLENTDGRYPSPEDPDRSLELKAVEMVLAPLNIFQPRQNRELNLWSAITPEAMSVARGAKKSSKQDLTKLQTQLNHMLRKKPVVFEEDNEDVDNDLDPEYQSLSPDLKNQVNRLNKMLNSPKNLAPKHGAMESPLGPKEFGRRKATKDNLLGKRAKRKERLALEFKERTEIVEEFKNRETGFKAAMETINEPMLDETSDDLPEWIEAMDTFVMNMNNDSNTDIERGTGLD